MEIPYADSWTLTRRTTAAQCDRYPAAPSSGQTPPPLPGSLPLGRCMVWELEGLEDKCGEAANAQVSVLTWAS